ncbi:hypothetical protein NVP1081O_247 [Vibrio phage 1.081.O._10N.286.52.C2]|nr:hypothetical protein NVP1081O_247 [Vibrio phage 1.081.O._10N.286.52.C2]
MSAVQPAIDVVTKILDEKKEAQFGWVSSLAGNYSQEEIQSRKNIIANLAIEIVSLERLLDVSEAVRGLGIKELRMVINEHYKNRYKLDENDEWVENK